MTNAMIALGAIGALMNIGVAYNVWFTLCKVLLDNREPWVQEWAKMKFQGLLISIVCCNACCVFIVVALLRT